MSGERTKLSEDRTLAPGGSLAAAIPHFEDRPEQRRMSAAVEAALADARPLLVEAGTGTGKTLAYLVPALASGKRVVVSTGTRTLQDQILRHDVPLLRQILPRPFTAVALKGVGNYVCKRKLAELHLPGPAVAADLPRLRAWLDDTETGDKAELDEVHEHAPIWAEVTTTPEARLGKRCPYYERCHVTAARRAADKADLVLVNHHLYFADLALRAAVPGARVLPDHDAVIFDEAHQLEEVATEHFGLRVTTARLGGLVRDARALLGRDLFGAGKVEHEQLVHAVDRSALGLFALARQALVALAPDGGRVPLPPDLLATGARQEAWFLLDGALEELARACDREAAPPPPDDDEDDATVARREQLASIARRARAVRDDLAELAEQRQRAHVYWGETRAGATALSASPISVADLVRRQLVGGEPTPVFTSATLTVAGSFDYTRARLGLEPTVVDELALPSPFDYGRQALLYLARDLPAPTGDGLPPPVAARIVELLAITAGRAFVLFTSHRAMQSAARQLAGLPHPLLRQGDAPRAALVERFRATPGAVLLGTGSFWEGVDVPGDALSLVIIDKLPFQPHTDPLTAARAAALVERGGEPFSGLQLPQAAIALKQGFGRLIRRRDDRGIVAILDPRIVLRTYGRVLLDSLPAGLPRTSAIEQVRRWWLSGR
ncbi:MAG TPA: ATP-dependent DNA helicase [Kofleriaceae bacterium]|nr:ATP-dependent DNA helicase [Kofleriaceae bacterium]